MADGTIRNVRLPRVSRLQKRRSSIAMPTTPPSAEPEPVAEDPLPAPAALDRDFIPELYMALNPDVADALAAGQFASAWEHWVAAGERETQLGLRPVLQHESYYTATPKPAAVADAEAAYLDAESYLYLNPDVRTALGGDLNKARQHWLQHGRYEARRAPGIAPFRPRQVDFGRLSQRPFGLNVFGPFMAKTGLGTACRNMLAAIKETKLPFEVWNFDTSRGPARIADIDRARKPRFNTNVIFANADQAENVFLNCPDGFFDDSYTIAVWQWELAAFRPDWFSAFGAVDEVWTNSSFQAAAIRTVSPVPVVQINLPIIAQTSTSKLTRRDLGIAEDAFVFLLPFDVGSTIARKNPLAGVAAFKEAFPNSKDVVLIVKYQTPEHDKGFGLTLSRLVSGVENIRVIAQTFSPEDMAGLRQLSNALLSPHRSEGFGLNIGEFMLMGKPIIATNYSGNTDFFDDATGYPVNYQLTEITKSTGPYPAGYIWAEPDHASLVQNMRDVVHNAAEAAARSAAAKKRIAENFSPARIAWDIITRLRKIELDRPLPGYTRWIGRTNTIRAPSPLRPFGEGRNQPAPPLKVTPSFSIVMPVYNVEGPLLARCIQSVLDQTYPFWELCIANDASTLPSTLDVLQRYRGQSSRIKIADLPRNLGIAGASNHAASLATGEFIALLDNDDELDRDALAEMAAALNKTPDLDCLYCDEIKIDKDGHEIEHFFKPDWSPEHLESVMYVLHMLVVRKSLFLDIGQFRRDFDGAQDYDLMLRLSRATDKIGHVSKPLYRWRAIPGSAAMVVDAKPKALESGIRALTDHVTKKYGAGAKVERGLLAGTFRVRRDLAKNPPVTLMILTNNAAGDLPGRGNIRFVDNFVASIQALTAYKNYELVVVDNSSLTKAQVKKFEAAGVQVLNYEFTGPFNYAAKANFSVRHSRTELVVLLNDDMEVISPDWLGALVEYAQDPEIGAVGARLLHADGSLQHAGAVIGLNGSVGHVYHNADRDFVGYNGFTHIIRNFSAVTAACFATRKSVVMHAGGFDERFATDFNDIDLCLRIRDAGYRIVYTPYAELYHFEGQSIARVQQNPQERQLFLDRWLDLIVRDPYYNENLTRSKLDYTRA